MGYAFLVLGMLGIVTPRIAFFFAAVLGLIMITGW